MKFTPFNLVALFILILLVLAVPLLRYRFHLPWWLAMSPMWDAAILLLLVVVVGIVLVLRTGLDVS